MDVLNIDSALGSATHLLANRFGGTPELTHPEDLGGSGDSLVIRVRVTPNPFLQERTVVIKQLPPVAEDADSSEATAALIREVVAYQYTNTLAEGTAPVRSCWPTTSTADSWCSPMRVTVVVTPTSWPPTTRTSGPPLCASSVEHWVGCMWRPPTGMMPSTP